MKLSLSLTPGQQFFTAHGPDYVIVSGERYQRPVAVTPERVLADWPATTFAALAPADFEFFLDYRPEVVLLGTGATHRFAHPALYAALSQAGIGVECMNTAAACRTYNILMSEDRKVVAAILFE